MNEMDSVPNLQTPSLPVRPSNTFCRHRLDSHEPQCELVLRRRDLRVRVFDFRVGPPQPALGLRVAQRKRVPEQNVFYEENVTFFAEDGVQDGDAVGRTLERPAERAAE